MGGDLTDAAGESGADLSDVGAVVEIEEGCDVGTGIGDGVRGTADAACSIGIGDSSKSSTLIEEGDCVGEWSIWTERDTDTDRDVRRSGGGEDGERLRGTVRGERLSASIISTSCQ